MDSIVVEIRAAEGGDLASAICDAKQLVVEQTAIYARLCGRREL
ncbi:MAG TPA: hypothetical protein VGG24_00360 [Paraburkholderia sp.]|jgi:hypothetical protein